jgi:hypothetical protein
MFVVRSRAGRAASTARAIGGWTPAPVARSARSSGSAERTTAARGSGERRSCNDRRDRSRGAQRVGRQAGRARCAKQAAALTLTRLSSNELGKPRTATGSGGDVCIEGHQAPTVATLVLAPWRSRIRFPSTVRRRRCRKLPGCAGAKRRPALTKLAHRAWTRPPQSAPFLRAFRGCARSLARRLFATRRWEVGGKPPVDVFDLTADFHQRVHECRVQPRGSLGDEPRPDLRPACLDGIKPERVEAVCYGRDPGRELDVWASPDSTDTFGR